jgi:iron complex outermembrane receptor protein
MENWTAYVQAAQGFLAPPISVLEVTAAPPAVNPEETWNYQVGTTAHLHDWVIGVDAYYIDFNNYITSVTNGGFTSYINGGGAIYKGAEAELQYVLGEGYSLYGNASYNNAEYKHTNVQLAETPQWTGALGLLYDDVKGPYFSIISKWIGRRNAPKLNRAPTLCHSRFCCRLALQELLSIPSGRIDQLESQQYLQ